MASSGRFNNGLPAPSASKGVRVHSSVMVRLQRSELFRNYQEAFEDTTGLPLTLRETGSFQTPLQGSKRANPFCTLMTRSNETCSSCLRLQRSVEEAATLGPKTLKCYAGLSESAVPIRVGNEVIGYLQTGQVFLEARPTRLAQSLTRDLGLGATGITAQELRTAYFQTRVVPRLHYESVLRLLAIFAEHLGTVSNQMVIQASAGESTMVTIGRAFIAKHQGEVLHLRDVSRALNMSPFYFCKLFKDGTGLTFTNYLARTRVESVKLMLLNIHKRVSEAAYEAGFQSLSQFNRVFRRITGEAPSIYRDRIHGRRGKPQRRVVRAAPI